MSQNCEFCINYEYDEECEDMVCTVDMDMDDYQTYQLSGSKNCPFFRMGDEYTIVHKQI